MGDSDDPVYPGGLTLHLNKNAGRRRRGLPKYVKAKIEKKLDLDSFEERSGVARKRMAQAGLAALSTAVFKLRRGSGKSQRRVLKAIKTSIKHSSVDTTTSLARALSVEYSPWMDDNSHPMVLYRDLTRLYDKDWLSWEPETIWSEVEEDEGLDWSVLRENKDKVMALRTAVRTDIPWNHHEVFENTALSFCGFIPRFDIVQGLHPYQAAFAIDVLNRIHPGLDFNDEVLGYVAANLAYDGLMFAPEELFGPVQESLNLVSRNDPELRDEIEAAWDSGREAEEAQIDASPVEYHLDRLHAIKDFIDMMDEQLELTDPLPEMDYDAEADETLPELPQEGLSAPARTTATPR